MGFLDRLFGKPSVPPESIRAKFDAAQTTEENRRHWQHADALSADASLSPTVRKTLRERARYEIANNAYAAGIVRTIVEDTVGNCPRLQITGATNDEQGIAAASAVEAAWNRWAHRIDLGGKLRTLRSSRLRDGEGFALLISNPRVRDDTGISLDLQLVECDQIATPPAQELSDGDAQFLDGIAIDRNGNTVSYTVMETHPGSGVIQVLPTKFRRYPSRAVIHYFRPDRPGQHRGYPEITPALPLFSQLRRYTLAVLGSAEAAASFAGIIYTDAPPGGEARPLRMLEPVTLERQALLTMPAGWRMEQLRAEQPTYAFADFRGEILDEIGRCLCVPSNIARGNSSRYNYASGRLDYQIYRRAIDVERGVMESQILDRVFAAWLDEAVLLSDVIPPRLRRKGLPHAWMWCAAPHVDPAKEAEAAKIRLESGLTTLADEYAERGRDWQEAMRQRAAEIALAQSLGLAAQGEDDEVEAFDSDDEDDSE